MGFSVVRLMFWECEGRRGFWGDRMLRRSFPVCYNKWLRLGLKIGGGLKRNDFDSNETKAAFEKAVSTATQKRVLLLG